MHGRSNIKKNPGEFYASGFFTKLFFFGYDSEERPVMVAFLISFLGPRLHLNFSVPIRLEGKNFSFLTIKLRNDCHFVSSVSNFF